MEESIRLALEQHPSLKVARADHKAVELALKAAGRGSKPKVSFVGVYQPVVAGSQLSNGYEIGFRLDWPIFDGARTKHAKLRAEAQKKASSANLRQAERESEQQVLSSLRALELAQFKTGAATAQVAKAEEALRVALAQYKFGFAEFLVARDAQQELTKAKVAQADSRYDLLEAKARLDWAMGMSPAVALDLAKEGHTDELQNQ